MSAIKPKKQIKATSIIPGFKAGEISKIGGKIYARIKKRYDPKEYGKYLAIDIETEKEYLGSDGIHALKLARKDNPGHHFFLQKIGFDTAESFARFYKLI